MYDRFVADHGPVRENLGNPPWHPLFYGVARHTGCSTILNYSGGAGIEAGLENE